VLSGAGWAWLAYALLSEETGEQPTGKGSATAGTADSRDKECKVQGSNSATITIYDRIYDSTERRQTWLTLKDFFEGGPRRLKASIPATFWKSKSICRLSRIWKR
jgi:hypothetical protein